MAPTLVHAPFHRAGWVYEEKVDGYRMLAYKDGDRVRLVSRNGVDHTRRYPDVAAAVARLRPSTLVLDGELRCSTSSYARASSGCAIQTLLQSPHRRCSSPSTCCT